MAGPRRHPDTLRAMEIWRTQGGSIGKTAKMMGLHESTLYRALFPNGKNGSKKRLALRKEGA